MKIVVTAEAPDLDGALAVNFARCPYFLLVEVESLSYQAVTNPWESARGGAGPEAARLVANLGVQTVVTGLVGPNAFVALQMAGVQVFVATGGEVRAAVNAYRAAHLPPLLEPNAAFKQALSAYAVTHGRLGVGRAAGTKRRQGSRAASQAVPDDEVAALRASLQAMAAEVAALKAQVEEMKRRPHEAPSE